MVELKDAETMDELKNQIYSLVRKFFGNPDDISHQIGRDFSEKELDEFISWYWDYINK